MNYQNTSLLSLAAVALIAQIASADIINDLDVTSLSTDSSNGATAQAVWYSGSGLGGSFTRSTNNTAVTGVAINGGWTNPGSNSVYSVVGSAFETGANNPGRGFYQFSYDAKATTGEFALGADLSFDTDARSIVFEIVGFNEADIVSTSTKTPNVATNTIDGITGGTSLMSVTITGGALGGSFLANTYQTYDIGTFDVDAGYDYYITKISNGAGGAGLRGVDNLTLSAVPEPGAFALVSGLVGLGFVALRRRR